MLDSAPKTPHFVAHSCLKAHLDLSLASNLLLLQFHDIHDSVVTVRECLIAESNSNLLECMASSLDIVEICKTSGEETEAGDDEVKVTVNTGKGIWRDHTDDKVEDPVAVNKMLACVLVVLESRICLPCGCKSHTLASTSEREDLSWK